MGVNKSRCTVRPRTGVGMDCQPGILLDFARCAEASISPGAPPPPHGHFYSLYSRSRSGVTASRAMRPGSVWLLPLTFSRNSRSSASVGNTLPWSLPSSSTAHRSMSSSAASGPDWPSRHVRPTVPRPCPAAIAWRETP